LAKYKAEPHYVVNSANKAIEFNHAGIYETTDAEEIKKLDVLSPTWIKCVEKEKPKAEESAPKSEPKKATVKRKPSAK
jgi:hypothetical protein